jgi:RHS repeat-associated protein
VLPQATTLLKATLLLPGGATAVYDSSGFAYFRHPDWLGSSRVATKWDHTIYSKEAYAPFGEPETAYESGTQDRSFTGQDQDTVSTGTGLYDFLYRRYHPVQGRWISPDPAGLAAVDPANPQTWNRYAYVMNSPMNATDPLGLLQQCGPGFQPFYTQPGVGGECVPVPPPGDASTHDPTCPAGFICVPLPGGPWGPPPVVPSDPGPPQLVRRIPRMFCTQDVIDKMNKAFELTGDGKSGKEATIFVKMHVDGSYFATTPRSSNEHLKDTIPFDGAAQAMGHVHPDGTDAFPTPGKDTVYADSSHFHNVDVFTFGSGGLWLYRQGYPSSVLLRRGLNWISPCTSQTVDK